MKLNFVTQLSEWPFQFSNFSGRDHLDQGKGALGESEEIQTKRINRESFLPRNVLCRSLLPPQTPPPPSPSRTAPAWFH